MSKSLTTDSHASRAVLQINFQQHRTMVAAHNIGQDFRFPNGILDAVREHGFDRAALKIVRAVEIERPVLDGHGLHLVEPGGDGRLGQVLAEAGENDLPDVCNRVHGSAPFFLWNKRL